MISRTNGLIGGKDSSLHVSLSHIKKPLAAVTPPQLKPMSKEPTTENITRNWFFFTVFYLFLDYARPQDVLPIGFLHLGMVVTLILSWYVARNWYVTGIRGKQMIMVVLFVFWLAVLTPFAANKRFAYYTVITMLVFLPFLFSVIGTVNTLERLKKLLLWVMIILVYVSIYTATHGGKGSGNYFRDENDVALYINTWLPLCYFLFLAETGVKRKLLYLGALLVGVLAVVKSFSRGGFVGLAAMLLVAWLYSSRKVVALIVVCVLGVTLYLAGGHRYVREMDTITNTHESTARERILSWEAAWAMFLDQPYGVGGNNFQVWFPSYQPPEMPRGMYGRVAHSLWFTLLPELGVFGVLIYGLLAYYNMRDIRHMDKLGKYDAAVLKYISALSRAYLASIVGYFASGTFLSVLYYPHYWYLTAIIVASRRVSDSLLSESREPAPSAESRRRRLSSLSVT
jgi:disulfide bond formation protein DsbB